MSNASEHNDSGTFASTILQSLAPASQYSTTYNARG